MAVEFQRNRRTVLAGAAALVASSIARADDVSDFPKRPIHIIVPYVPGGSSDASARLLTNTLAEHGYTPIIENRPGALGYIGTSAVVNAAPDGYTLLLGWDGSIIIGPNFQTPPFDFQKDLAPVTKLCNISQLLAVNPNTVKARNFKDLVAESKTIPGGLKFGNSGVGTSSHLAGVLLSRRSGLQITQVPYKGSGQAVLDVVGGNISMILTGVATVAPFLKSGQLVPIAMTTLERVPQLPDVPTVSESGVPGYEAVGWFGILAPARTPRPIIDKLHDEFVATLNSTEVKAAYDKVAFDRIGNTPEEFRAQIAEETTRWRKVVQEANIKLE